MFQPISGLTYRMLKTEGQALVVVCPCGPQFIGVEDRWLTRAAAVIHDAKAVMREVVRDLLHNPQIRSIVFDGACCCRAAYTDFWAGALKPEWNIDEEHLALVRRFVDLYDDDFTYHGPPPPFWPLRIKYLE
jgi:acetone carboxylase gamma subunit